jgi:hypothetical protein
MSEISNALAIPEIERAVVAGSAHPVRRRREARSEQLSAWSALEPWRAVAPAAFLALCIGFSLLPDAHAAIRVPLTLALGILIGVGTELCARDLDRSTFGRLTDHTLWIVPTGATIVIVMLLAGAGSRLSSVSSLFAAAVVATIGLQVLEVSGPPVHGTWTRAVNAGAAFALALAVFAFTPSLHAVAAVLINVTAGALVALVVLRDCRASTCDVAAYVGVTAGVVGELGLMLHEVRPSYLAAGIPLLGLYAVSTTAQAVLDRAPRRAYVEVALVTGGALALAALAVGRR